MEFWFWLERTIRIMRLDDRAEVVGEMEGIRTRFIYFYISLSKK